MSDKDFVVGKINFATTTVARPHSLMIPVPTAVAKPEPSPALSAIRALIQQLEQKIAEAKNAMLQARAEGDEGGDEFHEGRMSAYSGSLAMLDALCPAPVAEEDRP